MKASFSRIFKAFNIQERLKYLGIVAFGLLVVVEFLVDLGWILEGIETHVDMLVNDRPLNNINEDSRLT
jgi:hypothetical protein